MATLKKYNLAGKELGNVQVDDRLANAEANGQMIKDYIVAIRNNARQWSASTKGRSEVRHTTKKPHPQKGTGRARQGMLSAPQYRGGGRVFTPRPKFDQHVKINKKEKRAAIRFLLAEKIRENKFHVLDDINLEQPKTKLVAAFLKQCAIEGRVLFLGEGNYFEIQGAETDHMFRVSMSSDNHLNLYKSLRNLPKVEFLLAANISGYDVLRAHHIVVTEKALNELLEWLC